MEEKYQIIRGKRINDQLDLLEQLLEQSTVSDLEQNTTKFTPITRKRQHAVDEIRITTLETLPYVGMKTLRITAIASSSGKNYTPKLLFTKVEYQGESTNENITFTGKDGNEYNMTPINLADSNVQVRCDCMDFYWRFASYNAKDKSLVGGAPKPYQRVPGSNRGPSNPQQIPGLCKHLIATIKALKQAGMVT